MPSFEKRRRVLQRGRSHRSGISRRVFLSVAAGAVGGAVSYVLPLSRAEDAASQEARDGGETPPAGTPLDFLIVTDTHLGYRDSTRAEVLWRKTAAELDAAPGDFVLHLGDIVDRGREPQYAVYKAERDKIGKPVFEIPGNHDPQPLFEKHIRKTVDTVVDRGPLRCVLLNNSRRDSHDGFLSDRQLQFIDAQCRDAARTDRRVILAMHVPAHSNKHPDRGWYVKPQHGQTKLYELLRAHSKTVIALFHGHFHNGLRGWDDHPPVHEICFPSALYNLDRRLEAQDAPGYNPLEFRPGFTKARLTPTHLRLTYHPTGSDDSIQKLCRLG